MKLNKFLVVAAALGFAANAFAANPVNQGEGTIDFKGSIIDAPCSIDENASTKEVDLGQVSNVLLAGGGKSNPVDFKIVLRDCSLATMSKVKTTLTGAPSSLNSDLLGISGNAEGASIAIIDGSGAAIKLGTATQPQPLVTGLNVLQFSAYLQGDTTAAVKPGTFTSTASYALSYE